MAEIKKIRFMSQAKFDSITQSDNELYVVEFDAADYIVSYSNSDTGGYAVWKSGKIEQWGWKTYSSGVTHAANNAVTLHKPYTKDYAVTIGLYNADVGWGKYELSAYSLSSFSWRVNSSSGNYQSAPRRFSWYTVGV